MAFRVRFLLRCARVLVACLVLGMVVAPGRAAPSVVDAAAWVAGARSPASREAAKPREATEARPAMPVWRITRALRPKIVRRPARARVAVVRERIYLRHAALLC